MGTISTDRWLQHFVEHYNEDASIVDKLQLQLQTVIQPMLKTFTTEHPIMLQRALLQQGLFYPDESISDDIAKMKQAHMWRVTQATYQLLQKKWKGPKAKIFLLPATKRNETIVSHLGGKAGISYLDKVVLFVSPHVEKRDLQALLIHEYNHVCRLKRVDTPFKKLTLLDSIIIEGLAESAVKELLGEKHTAIWTTMYKTEEIEALWERLFKEQYELKGKDNHSPFLYGSKSIPRWAGYAIGYHMIQRAKSARSLSVMAILELSSEEILKISGFGLKSKD